MSIIKRIIKRKPNGHPRMENPETWAQDTELRETKQKNTTQKTR